MYDYDQIERIVMSVLQSSPDVFQQDGNVLKFKGDVIYNPNPNPGPKGDRGPQGESGEKGDKGPTGDKGDRGPQGINGKDGIVPNITGSASINGSSGTPSCTVTRTENAGSINLHFAFSGLKGDQGIQGVQGPKGDQGIQGPKGDRGIQGIQGVNGKNGKDGTNGADANTSEIQTIINNVRNQIDDEINRIESNIEILNSEIQEKSQQMVSEIDWIKETFPNGSGSQSNFGLQDVKEYLQTIALWEESDNTTKVKWSTIKQSVDRISAEVNQIKQSGIDYEALLGEFYSYITGEETITTGMQSTWSRFLGLGEDNIQLLEWMASGVKTQANSKESIAELFASAKNNDSEAYAGLETRVSNIEGSYVASSNLSTMVKNEVSTSISGLFTENSTNKAVARLYARLSTAEGKIDSMGGVDIETLADRVSATLFADNGQGTAAISAAVDEKISSITLSADVINIKQDNKTVAYIANNGRCSFNEGRVTIPTTVYNIDGNANNNATGIVITDVSSLGEKTGKKAFFEGNGFNVQKSKSIYCSFANTVDRSASIVSYLDSSDNYSKKLTFDVSCKNDWGNGATHLPRIQAYVSSELATELKSTGTFETNMTFVCPSIDNSSDENIKTIIDSINIDIESISKVRIVDYFFNNQPNDIRSGTIAQDWQEILPNAVKTIKASIAYNQDHLGLDYNAISIVSAVTAAREIVKLKQENEQLKERISNLEDKVNNFN